MIKIKKPKRPKNAIALKLKKQGKIDDKFELMVNRLSIEDLISLKLELTAKCFGNGKFYGFPVFMSISNIIKICLFRFVYECFYSRSDAAMVLGITTTKLEEWMKKRYRLLRDQGLLEEYSKNNNNDSSSEIV